MKRFDKVEKQEIINKVINKFMKEWDEYYNRHEMNVEYKLKNGKIIEIGTYGSEDWDDKGYYMTINLHDPRKSAMTWRYDSEFKIGHWWCNEYGDGDNVWKCDNTIKGYIKTGLNKIFKGIENEKD